MKGSVASSSGRSGKGSAASSRAGSTPNSSVPSTPRTAKFGDQIVSEIWLRFVCYSTLANLSSSDFQEKIEYLIRLFIQKVILWTGGSVNQGGYVGCARKVA